MTMRPRMARLKTQTRANSGFRPGRSVGESRRRVLFKALLITLALGAIGAFSGDARAVDDGGTFVLISPRSSTAWVTSPGRFHNGCSAEEDYDSPDFDYSEDVVVIAETTVRDNAIVGYVAPTESGCWPEHIHVQVWNYVGYARIYDLDGPQNNTDTALTGPCERSGGSDSQCNVQLLSSDGFAFAGGESTSTEEHNNPHFVEF